MHGTVLEQPLELNLDFGTTAPCPCGSVAHLQELLRLSDTELRIFVCATCDSSMVKRVWV